MSKYMIVFLSLVSFSTMTSLAQADSTKNDKETNASKSTKAKKTQAQRDKEMNKSIQDYAKQTAKNYVDYDF
ncbi:MAG: hypothetical protein ACTHJ4_08590 [Candidatus Nucleicultricaceae bacterium]